jgi:hypothetical protein
VTCALLGAEPGELLDAVSFARVPSGPNDIWWLEQDSDRTPEPLICRMVLDEAGDRWLLTVARSLPDCAQLAAVHRFAERAVDAVSRADLDGIVRGLVDEIAEVCGLAGCLIVLIDERSGEPTFAGGISRQMLAAMEECRRRGAPMVIWQAFAENRLVVRQEWLITIRSDPRLAPIRRFVDPDPDPTWTYVAVPVSFAGRRIGVVAGLVRQDEITPARVQLCITVAVSL